MKINTDIEIDLPTVPVVIYITRPTDDAGRQSSVDIADMNEDALKAIGREWANTLLDRAEQRRADRKNGAQL